MIEYWLYSYLGMPSMLLLLLSTMNIANAQQTIGSCYADYLYWLEMASMFTPADIDITDKELQRWILNLCTYGIENGMWDDGYADPKLSEKVQSEKFEKFKQEYGIPKALLDMQDQLRNPNN